MTETSKKVAIFDLNITNFLAVLLIKTACGKKT